MKINKDIIKCKTKISLLAFINIFLGFIYKDFYLLMLFLFSDGVFGKITTIAERKSILVTILGIVLSFFLSFIFFRKLIFSKEKLNTKNLFFIEAILFIIGIILGTIFGGILY